MPVSRRRKTDNYQPVAISQEPKKYESPRWLAPLMVVCLILGLLWVVVFYIAGSTLPVMKDLGNLGNIGIGFGLMAIGFFLSTKWH
ncbi:MAG: cell division protein CrgA [Actinobacteria bacterium]|nr:cell division protein CrgA [Actinomycetota bacterium]